MGKASRTKHLKRQHSANLERYGGVKLSDVLFKISEPFDDKHLSFDDHKKLIMISIAAWNIANFPAEKRVEQALGFLKRMPGLDAEMKMEIDLDTAFNDPQNLPSSIVMARMLMTLMERKLEFYPHDDRIIVDFELTETEREFHLSVYSKMPDQNRPLH